MPAIPMVVVNLIWRIIATFLHADRQKEMLSIGIGGLIVWTRIDLEYPIFRDVN